MCAVHLCEKVSPSNFISHIARLYIDDNENRVVGFLCVSVGACENSDEDATRRKHAENENVGKFDDGSGRQWHCVRILLNFFCSSHIMRWFVIRCAW